MDSVQICFICLDAIYNGHILLYSSLKKKKKLQCDMQPFSTGKNRCRCTIKTQQHEDKAPFHLCLYCVSIDTNVYVSNGKASQKY